MAVFTNQARLTYTGGAVSSNVARGTILDVVSVTKTAVGGSYRPGDRVTYVVSVVNAGTSPVTGVTVSDDLGSYEFGGGTRTPLTYVDGSATLYTNGTPGAAPTVTPGAPLVFGDITVPANGNVMIVYEADVNGYADPAVGGETVNTATVTGNGIPTSVTAQAVITAEPEPGLAITKSISPDTLTDNSTVTYTFEIDNNGNTEADAGDAVVLTDTFDPILSGLTVTLNGTPLTAPDDYSYDETTGEFSTVPGRITVPAAGFARSAATGEYSAEPGRATLTVTGTI